MADVELQGGDPGSEPGGALNEVRKRAEAAGIDCQDVEPLRPEDAYVALLFPCGRETRRVGVFDEAAAKALLATPFEQFVFLGDYEAICSYSGGFIEALLVSTGVGAGIPLFRFRELLEEGVGEETPSEDVPGWGASSSDGSVSLRIGRSSQSFRALARGPGRADRGLTLQIQGASISTHDSALLLLEKLANSLFFQIESMLGIPLTLRRRRVLARGVRAKSPGTLGDVKFPEYEYDPQPISLYWYGAGAVGMPLLQFLAYYQAIEFYFPVYSQHDARRRLRNVLKDPLFDPQSDVALGRLMSVMSVGRGGGVGAERDQLAATIDVCLTEAELVAFITETTEREEFFRSKQPTLTRVQLRVGDGSTGIRDHVAARLYDVRCRIVHAKEAEHHPEAILPFSREADLLAHDIQLARFVARRVLIASSRPISL